METFNVGPLKVLFQPKKSNTVHMRFKTGVGSEAERQPDMFGAAHFLEHMMFKGTKTRDKHQILLELGKYGSGNAHTSFGETAYHMTMLPENIAPATSVLFDIFFNSIFDKDELDKEKNVILEELQSYKDSPDGFYGDCLVKSCFGDAGHEIVGTAKSIKGMTSNKLSNFVKDFYHQKNIVLLVAGPITKNQLIKAIEAQQWQLRTGDKYTPRKLILNKKNLKVKHAAKQSILGFVYEGINRKESYKQNLVDALFRTALGGGFGSLLFSKVREDLGLCYYVNSFEYSIAETSAQGIMTGMDKKNIPQAKDVILRTLEDVKRIGFADRIMDFAKSNLKFKIAASGDSAQGEIYFMTLQDEIEGLSKKEMLKKIDKLTNKDMIEFAQKFYTEPKQVILNP